MAIDRSKIFLNTEFTQYEGILSGSGLKPGMAVQIQANTALVGGRNTYEVFTPGANGNRGQIYILMPDSLQGFGPDDTYTTGDRCFVGAPRPGCMVNVRVKDVTGTGSASDFTVGEKLMAENATGLFLRASGSEQSAPFQVIESVNDLTSNDLVPCYFTGY